MEVAEVVLVESHRRQPFGEVVGGHLVVEVQDADRVDGPPEHLGAIADPSLCVAIIHGENAGAENVGSPRWERRTLNEVSHLLGCDRVFYVALRDGKTQSAPVASKRGGETVTVSAQFNVYSGYGSMAEYLVLGMARAGATVNVVPQSLDPMV